MSRVDWIQRGEYTPEPCPRLNPCAEHRVALLHNLTADGVEHVGYFILCDSSGYCVVACLESVHRRVGCGIQTFDGGDAS